MAHPLRRYGPPAFRPGRVIHPCRLLGDRRLQPQRPDLESVPYRLHQLRKIQDQHLFHRSGDHPVVRLQLPEPDYPGCHRTVSQAQRPFHGSRPCDNVHQCPAGGRMGLMAAYDTQYFQDQQYLAGGRDGRSFDGYRFRHEGHSRKHLLRHLAHDRTYQDRRLHHLRGGPRPCQFHQLHLHAD